MELEQGSATEEGVNFIPQVSSSSADGDGSLAGFHAEPTNSDKLRFVVELQRIGRGHFTRQNLRRQIEQKILESCKPSQPQPSNRHLLRYGLLTVHEHFALCTPPEQKIIVALSDLIARSMVSSSVNVSFASLFLSTEFMNMSSRLISALFPHLFAYLKDADLSKIIDARAITIFACTLDLLSGCSEQQWAILRGNAPLVPILDMLCAKITSPSATPENIQILLKVINYGLKGTRQFLNERTIDELVTVLIRFMRTANFDSDKMCEVFLQLLKVPTVTLAISKNTLKLVKEQNLFSLSIVWLSTQQNQQELMSLSTNDTLNLVANLIHLGNADRDTITCHMLEWARLVNILLQKCSHKASKQRQNNCWHHPLLGWTSERIDERVQGSFVRLRRQLSCLWNRDMVRCLSDQFLANKSASVLVQSSPKSQQTRSNLGGKNSKIQKHSSSFATDEANLPLFQMFLRKFPSRGTGPSDHGRKGQDRPGITVQPVPFPPISPTIVLCQLYRSALLAFPNSENEILASLGRDDSLVLQHLWAFLNEDIGGRLQTYLGYLVSDPEVQAPHFAPLELFTLISFTLISILDECEMYESERPFSRDQLRQIASFANRFCFQALWNELIDFDKSLPSKLFNSLYQLLQILYNRDCRRQFAPDPGFWTVGDVVSPKVVVAEFERSGPGQRAHILMDKMPHVIPLRDRIVLFRKLVAQDKEVQDMISTIITVERSRLIEDGYRQLSSLSAQALRGTIRVKFINQQGLDEAGIDQDGVFKEFLELTLKKVFDPDLNLFKSTSEKLLYPSSTSSIQENHLDLFQFVGRVLAKTVYEGICVDVQLAPVLLAAVLGKQLYPFDELATLDPVLYKNLTYLKHYSDSEDVADLELTFCAQEEFLGRISTVELISGGRDIKVDNENKISYIHLMAHHRVIKQIRDQSRNFVAGFRFVIQPKWLSLFSTHELQYLISGKKSDLDLNDLRKHVQYYGGFHSNHRLIKWLWSILEQEFSVEERRLFLKFVTSCSRPPLLGFAHLEPCFSIRCIETSDDLDQGDTLGSVIRGFLAINKRKQPVNERLPTASTCFNLLKLPNYTKRSILLEKLRYAIHSETGFELS